MKLTMFIIIISLMQVTASTFGQKLTLKESNITLEKVFREVMKQTGYDVLVSTAKFKSSTKIDVDFKDASIQDVMEKIIKNTELTYTIEDKNVVIKERDKTFIDKIMDMLNNIDITGRVVDQNGFPLSGATVKVKTRGKSVNTDARGNFYLKNVEEGSVLVISFMGYVSKEFKAEKDMGYVVLEMGLSKLDEVQVIAYGTESKRFSVGSVFSVTADQIEKQPVTNPLLALQGLVPGLAVTATNGVPGSTTLLQIRGQNTLAINNTNLKPYDQPYFIVDGVPFASQNVNISQLANLASVQSFSGGISQSTGISPFNNINPNDIESITILKDADATSIYGSLGANGVVLITTKKGRIGKTTFELNVNSQFNQVARPVQLLNTQQYLQLRRDAFTADGITPSSNPNDYSGYAPDLTIYDQNKYTNWQKVIQGNNTNNTDVHASMSGGSANSTFIVSGGYTRSNYNYPGNFSNQRYTLHSALHSTSTDKKATLDLITDYGYSQNNSAGFGGSGNVVLPPNSPDLIDGAGDLIWGYKGVPFNDNFYALLKRTSNLSSFNFGSSLNLHYEIIKDLKIGVRVGYNRTNGTEHSIFPLASQDPSQHGNIISASFANSSDQSINVEPQINYSKNIGNGKLTILIGGTYSKNTTSSYRNDASGYANDNFLNSINGAAIQFPSDAQGLKKYVAFFGRLNYIYDQKYILQISGRRDGSSYFGPGNQFGNFGSVGAGWIFSEEKAFKDALPFFSYGKLSGSYGTTGSDALSGYLFQALYQPISNTLPFQGIKQNIPLNAYNPNFKWAEKRSINIGLDFGFFNNSLLLNATYYRNRESDQLVDYPLAAQAGFQSVFENQDATIQNKGWEFTATSTNIRTKNFSWTTNFNFSFNRNKLLAFNNLESSSYAGQYIIGQPTSIQFGYKYKGVNPTTGLFEFYAADGSVTSNPKYGSAALGGDQTIIGNREANFQGGFSNTFTYKQFSLYIFCQFSSKTEPNALAALYSSTLPGQAYNLPTYVEGKYWTTPGQNATLQKLSSSYSSVSAESAYDFGISTAAYSNDTYLRVKTAALSYAFPKDVLRKIHIQGASLYINAQNLFTITNYKFGDPEQPGSYTAFPLQRIIAFGFSLKL